MHYDIRHVRMDSPAKSPYLITLFGGRKFILSVLGIIAITALSLNGADPTSYGAIALIVGSYAGANGFIEGKHAKNKQTVLGEDT